ncbi:hypothetical protein CI610_02586 [invertebrate metagenome]|uniref:SGNH hydrolase-type esterase domain-containing protein n=1 Tax=invertebrate metagenome TaxID=1711999 RepID=A0A2H9T5H8_9ZZZZ
MSLSKLKKFLEKPLNAPDSLKFTPVLLTSSKGFSLRNHLDIIECLGYKFDFYCKAGAKFDQSYSWLTKNLSGIIDKHGNITLYIWLGTCDITTKRGPFISLSHSTDEECSDYCKFHIDRLVKFISTFSKVKLVFLEIPPYSIRVWNAYKGHANPESYNQQDVILENRIEILNSYIKDINCRLGVHSLNFRCDLLQYKRAGRKPVINYSLYKDGIHPSPVLARFWMKRLVAKAFVDCC